MTKFHKLAQLNKDIELLESYGDFKSADILHNKFIRLAQSEVVPASYKTPEGDRGPTYKKRFNQKLKAGLAAEGRKKDNIISSIYADPSFFDEDKKQLESLIRGAVAPTTSPTSSPTSRPTSGVSSTGSSTGTSTNENFTELQTDLSKVYMAKLNAAKNFGELDSIQRIYKSDDGILPQESTILDDRIVNIKNTKRNNLMSGLQNSLDAVSVPSDNSATETTNESSIPKLKERIQHYKNKIDEYYITKDQAKKKNMLKYLKKFIKENYDNQLLDSKSYVTLMNDLGIKIVI